MSLHGLWRRSFSVDRITCILYAILNTNRSLSLPVKVPLIAQKGDGMKGVKITAIILLLTFGCLLIVPAIDAVTVTKDDSYSSTDTVMPADEGGGEFYHIEATDDYSIEYSVKVVGAGTVQVYLARGSVSQFTILMVYYEFYSTDENTKEASEDMPVASGEGNEYTLVVITEEATSVTYDIKIKVVKDAVSDAGFAMICISIIIIIVVLIVIAYFLQRRRDKKRQDAAAGQSAYPPPPAQPQYMTTAQQLYGDTEFYASQQPHYPGYPAQQYPQYPDHSQQQNLTYPQQPRQPY